MKRSRWSILAIAGILVLAVLPAIAAAENPTFVGGNSECSTVGSAAANSLTIFDPVVDGTYTGGDGSQFTLSNTDRQSFDFATNGALVYDVIVKGSGSNWYDYDGGSGAVRSDTDLVIPNGNKLNLVHFCYAGNNIPVANADSFSGNEDTTITGNVRANDTDADGDTLTAVLVVGPSSGALTLNADGSFSYVPNANFNGTDSFTYKASDGFADSNTATVNITVNPVNDVPVANADSFSGNEDTTITGNLLANDTDVEGDALTAAAVGTLPTGVSLASNGIVSYTPAANFHGQVTFSYKANDGSADSNQATVTLTVTAVNDSPVAVDDSAQVERDSFVVVNVLGNDTDVDGDVLTVAGTTPGTNGTTSVNLDGTVRYTPNAGFVGLDSFDYTVSDGNGGTDVGTVSVTVIQVICANETVTDQDGAVSGTFTRLSDTQDCKEYVLDASGVAGTVLFQPQGDVTVAYRGYLEFGGETPPAVGSISGFSLFLEYDPNGGENFQSVPWCTNNVFDTNGDILSADIPAGHTWCIASAYTRGVGTELVTTWQVYGEDDPKFR